jgi:mitochondrial fission protein ELM1
MIDLWILTHRRIGDLEQMRAFASMLQANAFEKKIIFKSSWLARLMPFLSLRLMDRKQSDMLVQPWPDLVLVAEGALGPVALDIRRRSRGKSKVICLGRPRGRISDFDLIITTPQFGLSPGPNILELTLPLHELDRELMRRKAADLQSHLAHFPRPWIVLLVGGTSAPEVLDEAVAADLGRTALAEADKEHGTLLVVTSPRTGKSAEWGIRNVLGERSHCCFWNRVRPENPYLGYLYLADKLIVTSDSISKLTEAISTGKPVSIYRLPQRTNLAQKLVRLVHSFDMWPFKNLFNIGLLQLLPQRQLIIDRLERENLSRSDICKIEGAHAKARTFSLIRDSKSLS